ncbi:MAG TPA: response regulator transcription factor [Actinomycetales bacterium]|nr:response regulator transcription factor [Actinomycetales bacterium]
MGPRLLVVEDDDGIRASLRLALQDEGYDVVDSASAEAGLEVLSQGPVDLMLVDLMLGGMDGFTFIRTVRPGSDAPIIVLSARDDTHDIVAALEAGADDYVTKPFQLKEVTARLRALRRRGGRPAPAPEPAPDVVTIDAEQRLLLDPGAGRVRRADDDVHLTVTEYRLLCELASPPGRVLSRQALLESVWDRGFFGDERIVDVHVRRLRTKIESDASHPRLVVTVRGLGYRLDTR